jgi:hypothetical protein
MTIELLDKLILLAHGRNHLTPEDKDKLLEQEFIKLTDRGWMITNKGKIHVKEQSKYKWNMKRTNDYDNYLKEVPTAALNALVLSLVNTNLIARVSKKAIRALGYKLLRPDLFNQLGKELIIKLHEQSSRSIEYFKTKSNS